MDGETVARAEWLWANLPTGNKPWTSLPTHEKALVCHVLLSLTRTPPIDAEAVARAICAASGKAWRERTEKPSPGMPLDYDFDALNNHWRHKAEAAIAAMCAHKEIG